jgi:ElaB/YqjD/DUF883 family membrane-anchored ribosome-binding protein
MSQSIDDAAAIMALRSGGFSAAIVRTERLARGTFVSTFGFTAHHSVRKDRAMAARANVRSVVSDAQDKRREAVEAVSEVRDNVAHAIDKSLKTRPYTTLALTLALGFVLGAMWAR